MEVQGNVEKEEGGGRGSSGIWDIEIDGGRTILPKKQKDFEITSK